jgi:hypothetical protein
LHYVNANRSETKTSLEQEWGLPSARQLGKLIYAKGASISSLFPKKKDPRPATAIELTPNSMAHLQGPLRATILQNAKQTGNQEVRTASVQMEK